MTDYLTYHDFDLTIYALEDLPEAELVEAEASSASGPVPTYRARVLNSPAGQATVDFTLPFNSHELENYILKMGRPRRSVRGTNTLEGEAAREFGTRLYNAIFRDDVRDALRISLNAADAQADHGLRIRLRLRDAPALLDLPWEYLYDPTLHRFFCHSVATPLVRYPQQPRAMAPLTVAPPLQVLVMIANPVDVPTLDVETEWGKIAGALRSLEERGLVALTRLETATLAALQRQLRQGRYHVFHFVGHGGLNPLTGERVLYLEDEQGRARLVGGNSLGTLLADHRSLRLALLNACEGARVGESDPFAGVAQHLILQGIPAIIAMQFEITDRAAIILAQEFYEAMADGYPVEAALAEARKAIFVDGNDVEWGTPVLYSRANNGLLFEINAAVVAEGRSVAEREPVGREATVAVTATEGTLPTANPTPRNTPRTPTAGEERTIRAAGSDFPFVYLPAGPFEMGSNDYDSEKPVHTVNVYAFWLGKTPVTNAQFRSFVEGDGYANQRYWTDAGWAWRTKEKITQPRYWTDSTWNTPQQPVVGVSWYEVTAYAAWLAQASGQPIRLPTEAEWEKGARGTDGRTYPWGNAEPDAQRCNFNQNVGKTTDVGDYPAGAGPYGALDMAGNVWEWTATQWVSNYDNYSDVVYNGEEGSEPRALRGGSWGSYSDLVRSANRYWYFPFYRVDYFGFRVIVSAPGG